MQEIFLVIAIKIAKQNQKHTTKNIDRAGPNETKQWKKKDVGRGSDDKEEKKTIIRPH